MVQVLLTMSEERVEIFLLMYLSCLTTLTGMRELARGGPCSGYPYSMDETQDG